MTIFPISFKRIRVVDVFKRLLPDIHEQVSGRYLMGREIAGLPIRASIEGVIAHRPGSSTTFALDFIGIEDMSASVAEELGPILYTAVLARSRPGVERYVVYTNLSFDVRMGLDELFKRSGKVALCILGKRQPEDDPQLQLGLLGPSLPPPLESVIRLCYQQQSTTSQSLTDSNLAAASKKLTETFERYPGLIHRVKVYGTAGPRSWRYEYFPIVPLSGDIADVDRNHLLDARSLQDVLGA